jgi:stage III sporulation protein AG
MKHLRKLATDNKRFVYYLAALIALGALIMALQRFALSQNQSPGPRPDMTAPAVYTPERVNEPGGFTYERALEQRLEEFFSLVEGAGRVRVFISPATNRETVYAVDVNQSGSHSTEQDSQGGSRETSQYSSQEQTVMITDRQGVDRPLVLREREPQIIGIAIIAEGGDSPFVRDALTRAAHAVLGLDMHKIQVLTMKGD